MEGTGAVDRPGQAQERMRLCTRCEAVIPWRATTCASCGLSLVRQALADRYTQSPWQVVALSVLTFSVYDLYWFNRTWRLLRDLGGPARPRVHHLLLTLGLLVPGLNVYLVYRLFTALRDLALAAGTPPEGATVVPEPPEPAALTVLYLGLLLCWLLPTPWWLAARLAAAPLALAQGQVNRHVAAALPDVRGSRQMAWLELAVLAIGLFFTALLLNSTFGTS